MVIMRIINLTTFITYFGVKCIVASEMWPLHSLPSQRQFLFSPQCCQNRKKKVNNGNKMQIMDVLIDSPEKSLLKIIIISAEIPK